jgi:DNA (cytosine-5)-methyltransferase 1
VLTVGSLFSGIGGLDLGLERAGMQVRWQCEIDPYCRAVLAHHWPDVPCYEDIRDIDGSAERVDLVCGGFPCQPVSFAGKGLAQEDPRWLWPEFARVVGELRPRYVLVENVPGLVKRGLDLVVTGLAEMGYDAEWEIVSAAACGAPHLRERIFVVAHTASRCGQVISEGDHSRRALVAPEPCTDSRNQSGDITPRSHFAGRNQEPKGEVDVADADDHGRNGRARYFTEENWRQESTDGGRGARDVQDPDSSALESWRLGRRTAQASSRWWWATEPDVGRVAHGVPHRLAQLRALGNAVVPQVAEAVGRMILAAEA